MHKFLFTQIEGKSLSIDYLEVQSYEMNVYLVYLTVGNKSGMVYDKQDRPMRFFQYRPNTRSIFSLHRTAGRYEIRLPL